MKALDTLQSLSLRALQQHLQNGNAAALTAFWQELDIQGTPLVEPQGDGHYLVTLVWRDEGQHKYGQLTTIEITQSLSAKNPVPPANTVLSPPDEACARSARIWQSLNVVGGFDTT